MRLMKPEREEICDLKAQDETAFDKKSWGKAQTMRKNDSIVAGNGN